MSPRPSSFDALQDQNIRKRFAKFLVLQCVRNTYIEDLHAGTAPSTERGDYSDVKVVGPDGEIPWPELSRLSDREMRKLVIEVVNNVYCLLSDLADGKMDAVLERLALEDPLPQWFDAPHREVEE